MKKIIFSFFLFIVASSISTIIGQDKKQASTQSLSVKVLNADTNQGINGVAVAYNKSVYLTNSDGVAEVPIDLSKSAFFEITKTGFTSTSFALNDLAGMNSYAVRLKPYASASNIIVLDDDELQDDGSGSAVSSILRASRDNFLQAAAFNFRAGRFQVRGYENEFSSTYINGLPMQTLHNSRVPFNFWGGLNDVMRNNTANFGMDYADFGIGNLNGGSNTLVSARNQRKQKRFSYAISNRTYRNRLMYTHSTGEMKNGWAFSFAGSRRWAEEGYSEGTFYDAWSYFASAEKKLGEDHYLSLTIFGAPQKRGSSSGGLEEMYDIANDRYYNSNWGFLDGEKKSARNWNTHEPMISLKHEIKLSEKLSLNHTAGLIVGRSGRSRLDWYNASDPRPDYYRYLPSFYSDSPEAQAAIFEVLASDQSRRQLNWDRMFETNKNSFATVLEGTDGDTRTGLRSLYALQENREDLTRFMYNAVLRYEINPSSTINAGLTGQYERTHFFQNMLNLLGGEYWYDVNQFVEREFPGNNEANQADLNNPNRVVEEGDIYGYNYNSNITDITTWVNYNAVLPKVDFHIGAAVNYNSFHRDGLFVNGAFPDNSFGKSETVSFISPTVKAGLNYKINGRNYIYANATYMQRAPDFRNTFVSPRFRNQILDNPQKETAYSGEVAYVIRSPKLKAKALGYFTQFRNIAEVRSFFIDGSSSAFVNFISKGEGRTHVGIELAAEYKLTSTLSAKFVAGIGQNYIDVRPQMDLVQDNTGQVILEDETIYVKNFRLPGAQNAYTLGLSYNSPKYWFVSLNANYFDHMYLDYNPLRRTVDAVDGIERGSDFYYEVLSQTRLDPGFTLDLFGGKSWKIRDQFLYLNVGINNLLNNTNIISGGFEQIRLGTEDNSNTVNDLGTFPNRNFYAWGLNYFVSLSYRF